MFNLAGDVRGWSANMKFAQMPENEVFSSKYLSNTNFIPSCFKADYKIKEKAILYQESKQYRSIWGGSLSAASTGSTLFTKSTIFIDIDFGV